MKREKVRVKVKRKKIRKRWLISPGTRVHDEFGHKRSKAKEEEREIIEEELEEPKEV